MPTITDKKKASEKSLHFLAQGQEKDALARQKAYRQ